MITDTQTFDINATSTTRRRRTYLVGSPSRGRYAERVIVPADYVPMYLPGTVVDSAIASGKNVEAPNYDDESTEDCGRIDCAVNASDFTGPVSPEDAIIHRIDSSRPARRPAQAKKSRPRRKSRPYQKLALIGKRHDASGNIPVEPVKVVVLSSFRAPRSGKPVSKPVVAPKPAPVVAPKAVAPKPAPAPAPARRPVSQAEFLARRTIPLADAKRGKRPYGRR